MALLFSADASGETLVNRIVVNKARRELLLVNDGKIVKSYRVALGWTPVGPKTRQGDGKTPEGLYYVSGRNAGSAYHRSLRISYPDSADQLRARKEGVSPGGDIMIHGLPNGQPDLGAAHILNDWTAGCIAVTNEEIKEIWRMVPDGTPIQINP